MTTPDDSSVENNDYVSLDLPYGWCGLSDIVTATLSEVAGDGTLTAVGGELMEVDSCSLKIGFTDAEVALLKKA